MANLSSVARSAYNDLIRLAEDDLVANVQGNIHSLVVDGKTYWYSNERIGTANKRRYIGPDDAATRDRIERLKEIKAEADGRRAERARLTRLLRAEGMTPVDRETGILLRNLAKVGTFRLGGTLVGTHAFRLFEGDLGVTLPLGGAANTGDIDIAQFEKLSLALDEQVDPALPATFSALKFDPVPSLDLKSVWRWKQSKTGTLVEFLTPSFEEDEGIKSLPSLGVEARALHHLNYLIADAVPAIALYREGVLVQVPRPEKFAIHKLIVADRRRAEQGAFRSQKDREQAAFIIATLAEDRPYDLWEAYQDARARGPKWEERLARSLAKLPETREVLEGCA